MFFHSEDRRLPSLHRMTRSALADVRPFRKLAFVRIWFMAVHALGKNQSLFEISIGMALGTIDTSVLA